MMNKVEIDRNIEVNAKKTISEVTYQLQSKIIRFLRFPLIVAIVMIHSQPHREMMIEGVSI